MLQVDRLTKSFGGAPIFQDVCLTVEAGEAVSIMGPSGSGKTTFIRCLNGLERADRGIVSVGRERLDASDPPDRFRIAALAVRRQLGFVFQGWHLFAHRTVLDNVMEGPVWVRREALSVARRRAEALLDQVGVGHRAAAFPHELSGGEQQRAAIARALAMEPEALLLDEPTSALDEARSGSLADLLRSLVGRGLALVAVTHDAAFARAVSRRILKLEGGRLSTAE
jgi:polar amino acid transport system ATP-binding protein